MAGSLAALAFFLGIAFGFVWGAINKKQDALRLARETAKEEYEDLMAKARKYHETAESGARQISLLASNAKLEASKLDLLLSRPGSR